MPVTDDELVSFSFWELTLGVLVWSCGVWKRELPGDPVVVDVAIRTRGPNDVNTGPSLADIDLLVDAGVDVLAVFNVAVARVEVSQAALEGLPPLGIVNHIRAVPDIDRRDVRVSIGHDASQHDAVGDRFEELGGVLESHYDFDPHVYYGVIADEQIATLRDSGFATPLWVQHISVGCVG